VAELQRQPMFWRFPENFNKRDFFVTKLTRISHCGIAKHLQHMSE
jgi:hypothetical protein